MRRPGILFEVIKGNRKGLFGIAYAKEQEDAFQVMGKVFAHFYADSQCTIASISAKPTGLIAVENIKRMGYVD